MAPALKISRNNLPLATLEQIDELEAATGAEITFIRETTRYYPYRCTLHYAEDSQAYYGESVEDALREARERLEWLANHQSSFLG
jgi:hypothetical protein